MRRVAVSRHFRRMGHSRKRAVELLDKVAHEQSTLEIEPRAAVHKHAPAVSKYVVNKSGKGGNLAGERGAREAVAGLSPRPRVARAGVLSPEWVHPFGRSGHCALVPGKTTCAIRFDWISLLISSSR